jgi:hypothetical protein
MLQRNQALNVNLLFVMMPACRWMNQSRNSPRSLRMTCTVRASLNYSETLRAWPDCGEILRASPSYSETLRASLDYGETLRAARTPSTQAR